VSEVFELMKNDRKSNLEKFVKKVQEKLTEFY